MRNVLVLRTGDGSRWWLLARTLTNGKQVGFIVSFECVCVRVRASVNSADFAFTEHEYLGYGFDYILILLEILHSEKKLSARIILLTKIY